MDGAGGRSDLTGKVSQLAGVGLEVVLRWRRSPAVWRKVAAVSIVTDLRMDPGGTVAIRQTLVL